MYLPRSRALALISLAVLDGPAMVDSSQTFEAGVQLNFSEDTGRGSRLRKRVWNGGRGWRQLLAMGAGWGCGCWGWGAGGRSYLRGSRDLLRGVAVDHNQPPNLGRRDIFREEKGEIAGGVKRHLLLGLIT